MAAKGGPELPSLTWGADACHDKPSLRRSGLGVQPLLVYHQNRSGRQAVSAEPGTVGGCPEGKGFHVLQRGLDDSVFLLMMEGEGWRVGDLRGL